MNNDIINKAIYVQKVIYYFCIVLKDPVEPYRIAQGVPVCEMLYPSNTA